MARTKQTARKNQPSNVPVRASFPEFSPNKSTSENEKAPKKQRRSGKKLDESSSDDYGSTPKSPIAKVRIDVFKLTSSLFMMISAVEA